MKKKILIIDDHKEIREMYRDVLEIRGYEILEESNGLNGAMRAVEATPDLILLDIMMPQMDGFAVLEALKKNKNLNSKIFIITNLDNADDEQKISDLGAEKFIKKSEYTPDQVADMIDATLSE